MKTWITLWMKHGTDLWMRFMHSYPQIVSSMPNHGSHPPSTGKCYVKL